MQTTNIKARYRAHVQTLLEQKNIKFGAKVVAAEHRNNVNEALTNPDRVPDGLFLLLDYRDNNKKLARRTMNRLEAHILNRRLEGTGMAWALVSAGG